MVRHQPLQYYEPQLCLSCLTGIYGCRWKRYQRSHDDTTPVSFSGMEAEAFKSPVMDPGAEGNQGSAVSMLFWTGLLPFRGSVSSSEKLGHTWPGGINRKEFVCVYIDSY